MTSSTKKVAWIAGLVFGAVGLGTGIYFATKPKQPTGTLPPKTPPPGGGGGTPKPTTFVTPTASPGVFAAFAPSTNVSWVDENGRPIGGGGGGIDTAPRVPR